jgi:O-antigen/teichoic acid export membrane protein
MFRSLVKDTATYGLGSLVFSFVAFAVFPLYAHLFSVEDFGKMELVGTLATLAGLLMNPGLNNAIQRFYWDPTTNDADRPSIISTGLLILVSWSIVVLAIVFTLLYGFHGRLDEHYHIPPILAVLALVTVVPAQTLQYGLDTLRLHFSPWRFSALSGVKSLAGVAVGLSLIFFWGYGLKGYFWGNLAGAVIALPLCLWLIRGDLCRVRSFEHVGKLLSFGYPFIFASLAYWLFGCVDRWMLGTLTDNREVGLYSIAFKFSLGLSLVNAALGQAWSPYAMKIFAEQSDYRIVFSRVLSVWYAILTLLGAAVSLFAPEALRILTPRAYWQGATAAGFLAMAMALQGTTQVSALGISLEKKTNLLSLAVWITTVANFFLNYVMIPKWGALGSGVAMWLSYIVMTGLLLIPSQCLHPIPLEVGRLCFVSCSMMAALFAAVFFNRWDYVWWHSAAKAVLLAIIVASVWRIAGFPSFATLFNLKAKGAE